MKCVYVRSVNAGSECPSHFARETIDSPASSITEAYVWRKTWKPCSRLGSQTRDGFSPGCRLGSGEMTPAPARAGFHAVVFQVVRVIALRSPV